jgi:thioredoxin 2
MTPEETTATAAIPCPFCEKLNRVTLTRLGDRPLCGECGRPLLLDRPIAVGDNNLEKVVAESDLPVLVDFYADWCGPCKAMAPILDEVARDRAGEVLVTKLDTDRNPTMAVRFAIRGIPTLIVFRDGKEVRRESGAMPRGRLDALLDEVVGLRDL